MQVNLSFSPSFSLGLGRLVKVVNRFNGLSEHWNLSETVKTVPRSYANSAPQAKARGE